MNNATARTAGLGLLAFALATSASSDRLALGTNRELAALRGGDNVNQWAVTVDSTNATNKSATSGGQALAVAFSTKTSAMMAASTTGATTTAINAEAQASYSGTWHFDWQPMDANDWPSEYTITSIRRKVVSVNLKTGAGTGGVSVTGGSNLVSAELPDTSETYAQSPVLDVQVDTSDPNVTVTTRTKTSEGRRTVSGSSVKVKEETVIVERAYTGIWFQNHFCSPYDIELDFNVTSVNLTAEAELTNSTSSAASVANAVASETYSVK